MIGNDRRLQLIALMANAPSQDQEAILPAATLSGISIALIYYLSHALVAKF
jgi:hypothetical protein